MLQAVWTVGIILAVIAATDRRAWPSLALLALVLVQTAIAEAMLTDRLIEIAMVVPVDLAAGLLSLGLVTRERWTLIMPATFSLMLLGHGGFWLARLSGIDLWLPYVHAQNAILIAQLVGLCWPGGGRLIGIARDWFSNLRLSWREPAGVGSWKTQRTYRIEGDQKGYRRVDGGASGQLLVSTRD